MGVFSAKNKAHVEEDRAPEVHPTPAQHLSVALNSKFRSKVDILVTEIRELQVNANVQHWLDF